MKPRRGSQHQVPQGLRRWRRLNPRELGACGYAYPNAAYEGHAGIDEPIQRTYDRWGATGHTFVRRGDHAHHHDTVLLPWDMHDATGTIAATRTMIITVDDRRISHDIQFPGR